VGDAVCIYLRRYEFVAEAEFFLDAWVCGAGMTFVCYVHEDEGVLGDGRVWNWRCGSQLSTVGLQWGGVGVLYVVIQSVRFIFVCRFYL